MEKRITTLEELSLEAKRFTESLHPKGERATLVTLSGELGAGKTAFVKGVAKAFGVTEIVNSPTFVLEKIYTLEEGSPFRHLVHIDAYRLEEGEGLTPLEFDTLMQKPENLIMFEWPERVGSALPTPAVQITLKLSSDGSRTIIYD